MDCLLVSHPKYILVNFTLNSYLFKCYLIGDCSAKRTFDDKIAAKGVSKSININRQNFLEALFDVTGAKKGTSTIFHFDKRTTQMSSINQQRKLLNSFYI